MADNDIKSLVNGSKLKFQVQFEISNPSKVDSVKIKDTLPDGLLLARNAVQAGGNDYITAKAIYSVDNVPNEKTIIPLKNFFSTTEAAVNNLDGAEPIQGVEIVIDSNILKEYTGRTTFVLTIPAIVNDINTLIDNQDSTPKKFQNTAKVTVTPLSGSEIVDETSNTVYFDKFNVIAEGGGDTIRRAVNEDPYFPIAFKALDSASEVINSPIPPTTSTYRLQYEITLTPNEKLGLDVPNKDNMPINVYYRDDNDDLQSIDPTDPTMGFTVIYPEDSTTDLANNTIQIIIPHYDDFKGKFISVVPHAQVVENTSGTRSGGTGAELLDDNNVHLYNDGTIKLIDAKKDFTPIPGPDFTVTTTIEESILSSVKKTLL